MEGRRRRPRVSADNPDYKHWFHFPSGRGEDCNATVTTTSFTPGSPGTPVTNPCHTPKLGQRTEEPGESGAGPLAPGHGRLSPSPAAGPPRRKPTSRAGLAPTARPAPRSPPGPSPHLSWKPETAPLPTNARRPLLPCTRSRKTPSPVAWPRPLALPGAGLPLVPGTGRSVASPD